MAKFLSKDRYEGFVDIQLAKNLGATHQYLSIPATSRVTVAIHYPYLTIRDYSDEVEFIIDVSVTPPVIDERDFRVPDWVKEILTASTESLRLIWSSTEGADEKRTTVFAELVARGVNVLTLDQSPLRKD